MYSWGWWFKDITYQRVPFCLTWPRFLGCWHTAMTLLAPSHSLYFIICSFYAQKALFIDFPFWGARLVLWFGQWDKVKCPCFFSLSECCPWSRCAVPLAIKKKKKAVLLITLLQNVISDCAVASEFHHSHQNRRQNRISIFLGWYRNVCSWETLFNLFSGNTLEKNHK